jgi:uncharacterized protein
MSDITIIISLISLGFFGGFSHCTSMCGPLVLTQVSNRLENIPIKEFSILKKLQSLALLPYHLGRITTYTIIGILCSTFTKNIKDLTQIKSISAIFLFLASLIFLNLFFEKNLLTLTKTKLKNKLPFKSKTLKISALRSTTLFLKTLPLKKLNFLKSFLSLLFKNPRGLNGYLLGVILGFIPCGLLYGAFLLAASIDSPLSAGLGMLLFGIATIPALFLSACGGFIFLKIFKTEFKIISKAVILINSVTLFIMAISLIN